MNDDIIIVGGSICGMWRLHPVHEVLEGLWDPQESKRVINWYNACIVEKAIFSP